MAGGHLDFSFTFRTQNARPRPGAGPFRVLLVGDFAGGAAQRAGGDPGAVRGPVTVDAEHLDRAVAALSPTVRLTTREGTTTFTLSSLDDLHPDALFDHLGVFAQARELRARLMRREGFDAAANDVERWLGTARQPPTPAVLPTAEDPSALMARLLGGRKELGGIDAVVQAIVQPHITANVDSRRAALRDALDGVLATQMRAILADASLRAVEAPWRAAQRLVGALDTDTDLHIALLAADGEDLATDLRAAAAGGASVLLRTLDDPAGWSLVAVDHAFSAADADVLAALGALASRGGAAVIAGAAPDLVGAGSVADLADPSRWTSVPEVFTALRQSEVARSVALVLPGVLQRLSYGKRTEPTERFALEEIPQGAGAALGERLWGGAAFAVAQALGAAFREDGWAISSGAPRALDDLPSQTWDDGGEPRLVPATEVALRAPSTEAGLRRGVIPLVARYDRSAVHVAGILSIADPPAALAGPWDRTG